MFELLYSESIRCWIEFCQLRRYLAIKLLLEVFLNEICYCQSIKFLTKSAQM